MRKNPIEIYLRRKQSLMMDIGKENTPSTAHVATIVKNLESFGYTLSKDIIFVLNTYSADMLERFYLNLLQVIREMVGAHKMHRPMYPNFPQQVMEATRAELFINALIHYWSEGTLMPVYEEEPRFPLIDITKVKTIQLGSYQEFEKMFADLMTVKSSLSKTDKEDLQWMAEHYPHRFELMMPEEVYMKENAAFITSLVLASKNMPLGQVRIKTYFKTATDVLRLAVALSDGDISLADNTRFKKFKRAERRFLLGLLNNCKNLEEDMSRYREQWIRLGEILHPWEYAAKFPNIQTPFRKLRESEKIETFNGKVAKFMDNEQIQQAVELLAERPGEFARKLDHLLRQASESDTMHILGAFDAMQVPTPILLQVMKHFRDRGLQAAHRAFFPKGEVGKVFTIPDQRGFINYHICEAVALMCQQALVQNYGQKSRLGKVYIDERLKDYLVPFAQRSASKALRTVARGSRIDIPENVSTIRSFVYWTDMMTPGSWDNRVDIDLSAILYDENWRYVEHISYTNLRSDSYQAAHSGDITSAPNGASEFIDIDIDSVTRYGARYVMLAIYSYTNQHFVNMPECFMGWMERQHPKSGEIFEPRTVANKIDVSSDSVSSIPFVIDARDRKIIWSDIALRFNPRNGGNNVESSEKGLSLMGRALTSLPTSKPSLYDLFNLHCHARGVRCDNPDEADTIFSIDKGITPYDIEVIMSEYL